MSRIKQADRARARVSHYYRTFGAGQIVEALLITLEKDLGRQKRQKNAALVRRLEKDIAQLRSVRLSS